MKTIAFGHVSRVGKSTAQQFLVSHLRTVKGKNAQKASLFASAKESATDMFSWAGLKSPQFYEEEPKFRNITLPAIGLTPVELWVLFGEFLQSIRMDILVHDAWSKAPKCDYLIISDLRRIEEAELIKSQGGLVYRIDRPGCEPLSDIDKSMFLYNGWDGVISNTAGLKELHEAVVGLSL